MYMNHNYLQSTLLAPFPVVVMACEYQIWGGEMLEQTYAIQPVRKFLTWRRRYILV
jgi:hypothetical protein